jgi:hypothetical protein
MKTIDNINLHTWYSNRELDFVPEHFIVSKTPITDESRNWILEKLVGRFAIMSSTTDIFFTSFPAFEDPKEAIFYELKFG